MNRIGIDCQGLFSVVSQFGYEFSLGVPRAWKSETLRTDLLGNTVHVVIKMFLPQRRLE